MGEFEQLDSLKYVGTLIQEHWTREQRIALILALTSDLTPLEMTRINRIYKEDHPQQDRPDKPLSGSGSFAGIHKAELIEEPYTRSRHTERTPNYRKE